MLFKEGLDFKLIVELIESERVNARAKAAAERSDTKHWPILGGFWRQAAAEGVVDDLLERDVEQLRLLLEGVGEVVVES